jgi:hypothetical protein
MNGKGIYGTMAANFRGGFSETTDSGVKHGLGNMGGFYSHLSPMIQVQGAR